MSFISLACKAGIYSYFYQTATEETKHLHVLGLRNQKSTKTQFIFLNTLCGKNTAKIVLLFKDQNIYCSGHGSQGGFSLWLLDCAGCSVGWLQPATPASVIYQR